MNTTPSHFLVYDPAEQKWIETNLEDLTMRNDSELFITPVFETGQGKQCTWGEFLQQQKTEKQKAVQRIEEQKKLQEQANKANQQKRQLEEEAFKRKQEEENREVMATCIRTILENIEAIKADQLETNKKVRTVCSIFLIYSLVAAMSAISSFLK